MKHIPDIIYEKFISRLKPVIPEVVRDKKILVAVSGGPDSMFLLFLTTKFAQKHNVEVIPVYINHRVRTKKEIENDIKVIQNFCKQNSLTLHIEEIKPKKFDENTLRKLRYEKLFNLACNLNCRVIATGHTLDDIVETFFLNLLRGSGIKGLCSTPCIREVTFNRKTFYIVRPITDIKKSQILEVLKKLKIPYVIDRTNLETLYKRNFLRNKVLPKLKYINPNYEENVLKTISLLNNTYEIFNEIIQDKLRKTVRLSAGRLYIDLKKFIMYNEFVKQEILYRVVSLISTRFGVNFRSGYKSAVDKILQFLNNTKNKNFNLTKKINLKKTKNYLIIMVK